MVIVTREIELNDVVEMVISGILCWVEYLNV